MPKQKRETVGAQRLRGWIERSKFTSQNEAAEALGIHPVVLSQWLSADRIPDLENAHRLEDITGIATECWRLNDLSRRAELAAVGASRRNKTGR